MDGAGAKLAIWFWERIISPHNSWLLVALAKRGVEVVYLTEQTISKDRVKQGWTPPPLPGVRSMLVASRADAERLVAEAPSESIHICDGIRSNGLVGHAQRALARRGLRQWMVMETVDDAGWRGVLKRMGYTRLFRQWRRHLTGVLATGATTSAWVIARGVPADQVFPFAYFLDDGIQETKSCKERPKSFRFLYVGQFIERKQLNLLIDALSKLHSIEFELAVVGSGPLEDGLRQKAETSLAERVAWIGQMPIERVPEEMAKADCLVLPSRHDGWGAVVSEALMVGTPVICSDRCGSSVVVRASGYGEVFAAGNMDGLTAAVCKVLTRGRLTREERSSLADWAHCLGAEAGAHYLLHILLHAEGRCPRPVPPWEEKRLLREIF